jgi:hypothetical protein
MVLLCPWSLLGLLPVAAVAILALLRPGRHLAVVASLHLWRQAAESLDRASLRSRRVTAAWLLLLAGAAAAVMAMTRPVLHGSEPGRRVAIGVYPSAELASPPGPQELQAAVSGLLERLAPADRVRLLLPETRQGTSAGEWLTARQAFEQLREARPLPVAAADLRLPEPPADAQHAYFFAPSGAALAAGPGPSVIGLSARLPAATIDSFGAAELPGGAAQTFVALRNHSGAAWTGRLVVRAVNLASGETKPLAEKEVSVPASSRTGVVLEHASADALAAEIAEAAGSPLGTRAFLVRRTASLVKVAMIGRDEPMIRRFVRADEGLELVGSAEGADVVIANAADPPADKPALLVNPEKNPPGWRRGGELADLSLEDADEAADDPVMQHVRFSGVSVRRVAPWVSGGELAQKKLLTYKDDALILRDEEAEAGRPRRVYVAFDLGRENTNLSFSDSFVVFMSNAVRFLSPGGRGQASYESVTPLQAGPVASLRRVYGGEGEGPLPWPGIYRYKQSDRAAAGGQPATRGEASAARRAECVAVSLTGLRGEPAKTPAGQAVAAVPLPEPRWEDAPKELWPWLAAAAMLFWLAGWWCRLR